MALTNDPTAQLNPLINGIEVSMLTTVRADGTLHSCPMATQPAAPDGALWFFSGNHSDKVEAIKTDQRVNLAYSDLASQRYVSVTGNCELVRDHARAKELWDPAYKTWYPKGFDDPNLILLRVLILDVEYWDADQGRMLRLTGFAAQP
jgi:general stress protein 26